MMLAMKKTADYSLARRRMVAEQLRARGIRDARVLEAMERVPREFFVDEALTSQAYSDHPLNIGQRQTISQPFIVALMSEALQLTGEEKVLEIGTGSGYQTALLLELARQVYSIDRLKSLSQGTRKRLYQLGYDGFQLRIGDGTLGWPEAAPFDAIIVTAAGPELPGPYWEQLVEGGRIVMPIGPADGQQLKCYQKRNGQPIECHLGPCRFVPLIGLNGWQEAVS